MFTFLRSNPPITSMILVKMIWVSRATAFLTRSVAFLTRSVIVLQGFTWGENKSPNDVKVLKACLSYYHTANETKANGKKFM